jgi:Glycosyl hydrolase family 79 C-terminal beta domain
MLANDGIDRTDAVFHYNQHDYFYYIQVSGYALTRQYMMNHGNIVSQFTAWQTQQQQSVAAGKPYLLGEMAAVGPQGLALVTDVFGCALWTLDFFLYAASINVTRVLMHMTDIGNQSAWQPGTIGDIAPWVRPSYYGHIITSTLIGPNNDTTIAEIDVRSQELQDYAGSASAYVVYHGQSIHAAVVINLKEFNQTDTESSSTQLNFTFNVPPAYGGRNLTVFKLSAPGADSFKGVTWAGINYQTDNGLPVAASSNDTTTVAVSPSGQLSVLVRDTQAAVIIFDSSSPVILTTTSSGTSPSSTASSQPSVSITTASTTTEGSSRGQESSLADGGTGSSSSSSSSAAQRGYDAGNVVIMNLLCICMAIFLL